MGANKDLITKDMLKKMIIEMDKDGDSICSKAEFKEPYLLVTGKSSEEFEVKWAEIDKDKSGDVSIEELAEYYGYSIDAVSGDLVEMDGEMDDETILEALRMAAQLQVSPKATAPVVAMPNVPQERVKMIRSQVSSENSVEKALLEECQLANSASDATNIKKKIDLVLQQQLSVRIEDEQGKMPLHHLARKGDFFIGTTEDSVIRMILDAGDLVKDVNYMDNSGKTPLHIAAEYKQEALVALLLNRGANPLIQTKEGWNVLHTACNFESEALCKKLLDHPFRSTDGGKKKDLIAAKDASGRTPLHIAAYKAQDKSKEEGGIVKLLLDNGANPRAIDKNGNKPSGLAAKTNRKKSKELLDAFEDFMK